MVERLVHRTTVDSQQPTQHSAQPAGEASNKSTQVEREFWFGGRKRVSAWRCDAAGPGSGGAPG
ncbi:MAG: hypothetical protein Q9211_002733 [Gyalolechia sp. 1 TL-2023]